MAYFNGQWDYSTPLPPDWAQWIIFGVLFVIIACILHLITSDKKPKTKIMSKR